MHEVSLMESAIAIALDHAAKYGAHKIHWLKLGVGELSGVVPEALEFAFDVVTQGTIAEGAQLEIDTLSAICYCSTCDLEFQPADLSFVCPGCQQISAEMRRGQELELTSLEVS
ncbi:MAG: hydrogenase maturation nickel metallochaperone HypA [Cyanothece sp. SIO1E1]|nr:hydrogenase maturation nickel metallochaperone HypA [Cyanothece sp. SIO1E1]